MIDPIGLDQAAVEHLGRAILMLLTRFTSPDPHSPSLSESDLQQHIVLMIPAALRWLEAEGYGEFSDAGVDG